MKATGADNLSWVNDFRQGMPVVDDLTYLNHASVGPPHADTIAAAQAFLADQHAHGSLNQLDWFAKLDEARAQAAQLLRTSEERIAIMPNTSTGLMRALGAIPLQSGDEVVAIADAFPAIYFPVKSFADRGATLIEVEPALNIDLTQQVLDAITPRTRVVAIPWVGFLRGARLDLAALSEERRRRNFFLVVDAIQGVGVVPLALDELMVDFLSFQGAKWLLSPLGAGVLYASESACELAPDFHGWYGHEIDWNAFLRRDTALWQGARRYEVATHSMPSVYGFVASLSRFNAIGIPRIWERIRSLTDRIFAGLSQLPVLIVTPQPAEQRAGIVTFSCEGAGAPAGSDWASPASELFAELSRQRISVSFREGFIRVSPHFYNTEEEVDVFLAAVKGFLG